MEKLASITILSHNRQGNSDKINTVLTENSFLIVSRMGVNVQKNCTEKCLAMIFLAVKGPEDEITKLADSLREIKDLELKVNIFT